MIADIRKRGTSYGLILTTVIWIVLFVLSVVVPLTPKNKVYTAVQIQLAPEISEPPVVPERKKEVPPPEKPVVPAQVEEKKSIPRKVVPAKTTEEKVVSAKSERKTVTTKKTEEVPVSAAEVRAPQKKQQLTKSVEELMAEQAANRNKETTKWDESMFDNGAVVSDSTAAPSAAEGTKQKIVQDALTGSAAAAGMASGSTGFATSAGTDTIKKNSAGTVSGSTSAALTEIKRTTYTRYSPGGVSSETDLNSKIDGGNVVIKMDDGSERKLLDPSEPAITISEKNAALIDSSRTVTVLFRILAEGNVPLSGITITPISSLPVAIQSEIKTQISRWRFSSDSTDGQARFSYTIKKE